MYRKLLFIFVLVGLVCSGIASAAKLRDRNNKNYRLVCYYGAWANWRTSNGGNGKVTPEDFGIATDRCTHLVYGFSVLNKNTTKMVSHDPYMDLPSSTSNQGGLDFYRRFNDLRRRNRALTTLIAVGGWNEGNIEEDLKYSKMAADPAKRKIFIQSVVDFLRIHDFDGLDFDWEYPVLRDKVVVPEDRANFVTLLKELREAFEPYGFLLTAAVAAGKATMEAGYNIPEVSKYLDIINIMAYDFHGTWENYTGHHAPLYHRPGERGDDIYFNLDYAVQYWLKEGADPKKITLGFPLYGRCYTIHDESQTCYGSYSIGNASAGIYTVLPGYLGYNEICLNQTAGGWTRVWNKYHLAPYTYKGNQWCSYDDKESLQIKVQYLVDKGLSGGMVWSLDTDDFRGDCFQRQKFPLITAISDALEKYSPVRLTTTEPNTTPRLPHSTTTTPGAGGSTPDGRPICVKEGVFEYPGFCKRYLHCVAGGGSFQGIVKYCPDGLVFNPKTTSCDYKENVPGCNY